MCLASKELLLYASEAFQLITLCACEMIEQEQMLFSFALCSRDYELGVVPLFDAPSIQYP